MFTQPMEIEAPPVEGAVYRAALARLAQDLRDAREAFAKIAGADAPLTLTAVIGDVPIEAHVTMPLCEVETNQPSALHATRSRKGKYRLGERDHVLVFSRDFEAGEVAS